MKTRQFDYNVIYSDPERAIPFANQSDIRLLSCHLTPIPSGLKIQEHEHAHWELTFMISGEMKTFCDSRIIFNSENDSSILLIPPGNLHYRKFGEMENNCNLTIEFLMNNSSSIQEIFTQCSQNFFHFKVSKFLYALMEEIRKLARRDIYHPDCLLSQMSQLFLLVFLRDIVNLQPEYGESASVNWKFQRSRIQAEGIFRFLNTRISNKKIFEELSAYYSLSLKQLNRIFQKEYHKTLSQALDEIRLKRAVLMLQETALTVHDIAQQTGFSSQVGFHLFFKRHTGKAPQIFRRENRKNTV